MRKIPRPVLHAIGLAGGFAFIFLGSFCAYENHKAPAHYVMLADKFGSHTFEIHKAKVLEETGGCYLVTYHDERFSAFPWETKTLWIFKDGREATNLRIIFDPADKTAAARAAATPTPTITVGGGDGCNNNGTLPTSHNY